MLDLSETLSLNSMKGKTRWNTEWKVQSIKNIRQNLRNKKTHKQSESNQSFFFLQNYEVLAIYLRQNQWNNWSNKEGHFAQNSYKIKNNRTWRVVKWNSRQEW